MRPDMARVIVERPRRLEHATPRARAVALDDAPTHEGIARHVRNWGGKVLNENLKPLRRFLEKQIGRPWDKVYVEISAYLCPTSAVQQDVRDQVHDFVAVKPRRLGNQLCQRPLAPALLCPSPHRPSVPHRLPGSAPPHAHATTTLSSGHARRDLPSRMPHHPSFVALHCAVPNCARFNGPWWWSLEVPSFVIPDIAFAPASPSKL